jgi:hypothetical protein
MLTVLSAQRPCSLPTTYTQCAVRRSSRMYSPTVANRASRYRLSGKADPPSKHHSRPGA